MSDATMTTLALPRTGRAPAETDADRKLGGYDVGLIAAASMGLMVTARVVNLMANWM